MSLYRTVSTSYWTDSKVIDDFTPEDRYFYIYLFTNPHTNLCGCYEISPRQMVYEIGYSRESIENLLKRFEAVHKVLRYSPETKEMLLINWHKYNWTKSPKLQAALEKEIGAIKNPEYREYLESILYGTDTVSIPYKYPMDTSNTYTNTISNTISNTKKAEPTRHKYGEYKNVLLSDADMEKLMAEFPDDYTKRIEALSVYMKSKGTTYKDHLATIRNWARREKQEKPKSKNRFNNFHQREYDFDEMERRLL